MDQSVSAGSGEGNSAFSSGHITPAGLFDADFVPDSNLELLSQTVCTPLWYSPKVFFVCSHLTTLFLIVVFSLVLLFRATFALVRSVLIYDPPRRTRTRVRRFHDMIHVKWNRDVLHFPLPPLTTPLGQLRADLAAYTHLPVGSFKLVYKGAVMKEDAAPLSTYKLKENATIALIGGHTLSSETSSASAAAPRVPNPKTKSTSTPPTEESTILAIRHELERVRETLVPDVDAFVQALASSTSNGDGNGNAGAEGEGEGGVPESYPGPKATSWTPLDHSRLSELLLQSLLRLDALHVSGLGVDWPDARVQRKAAVREVQGVLDRLDEAWALR